MVRNQAIFVAILALVLMECVLASRLVANSDKFTECSRCLGDPDKKFCKNDWTEAGICCDKSDYSTEGCNDRMEGIICSNDLDYDEPDEPDYKKYMICP